MSGGTTAAAAAAGTATAAAGAGAAAAGAGAAAAGGISLADASLAVGLLGAATSAVGLYQSGQAAKASGTYNAEVAKENAQIQTQNATWAGQEGEEQAAQKELETRSRVGAIESAQSANGVDVNSGSNLDVRSSAAELGELDALNIRANAARQAYGYQTSATSDVAQSNLDRFAGSNAQTAGDIGAGSTILSGSANAGLGYERYLSSNNNPNTLGSVS